MALKVENQERSRYRPCTKSTLWTDFSFHRRGENALAPLSSFKEQRLYVKSAGRKATPTCFQDIFECYISISNSFAGVLYSVFFQWQRRSWSYFKRKGSPLKMAAVLDRYNVSLTLSRSYRWQNLNFSSPTFFNYNILILTFLPLNQTFTVQETF